MLGLDGLSYKKDKGGYENSASHAAFYASNLYCKCLATVHIISKA